MRTNVDVRSHYLGVLVRLEDSDISQTNLPSSYNGIEAIIWFCKCLVKVLSDLLSPSDLVLFLNLRK